MALYFQFSGWRNYLAIIRTIRNFSSDVFYNVTVSTVEPRYNKLLYDVLGIMRNDFIYPSNSKISGKEPR